MTKVSALFFLWLFLVGSVSVSAGPSSLRFLASACTVDELADLCEDPDVDKEALVEHCVGTHSLGAAKCYMKYMCDNHDQQDVNDHKECIDRECPLAKRMPTLDCEKYFAEEAAAAAAAAAPAGDTNTDTEQENSDAGDEEKPADADAEAEEEKPADTEEEETPAEEEEKPADTEEEKPADAPKDSTAMEDGQPVDEELIVEEEVQVEKQESTSQSDQRKPRGTKIFFTIAVPILVVLGFLAMRGKKETYPFDTHIVNSLNYNDNGLTPTNSRFS